MKANEIKVGKRVKYHPFIGSKEYKNAVIKSECYDVCGTQCCMIDISSSCVAIENLEANAPDKIYMPNELLSEEWTRHIEGEDIEYVRTDAFIEKACKFLSEKCDLCNYEEFDPENRTYYINHDKIVEDFKNYMKGNSV